MATAGSTPGASRNPAPPSDPESGAEVPAPGRWPTAQASHEVTATIDVSGTFDGSMRRYYGGALGDGGQDEGQDPLFTLADGATLRNVVIGAPAADGVHCAGTCNLTNVWWEDVGEDAATLKGNSPSQRMTIDGGGARAAAGVVFQHNGPGTMIIRNFQVADFGKLYRSCGNCGTQYRRHVVVENVTVTAPGRTVVGINTNLGDTATLSGITVIGDSGGKIVICEKYEGVTVGEPSKIGSGPDGTNCLYSSSDISYG